MKISSSAWSFLFVAWLLCRLDSASGESDQTDVSPGSPIVISDKFFSDTRKDYRLVGQVDWELGTLKLSPKSAMVRLEPLMPVTDSTFHLWPKDTPAEQPNVTRLSLLVSNGWELVIGIVRQKHQGQMLRQVVIAEINRGGQGDRGSESEETSELRTFGPFALPGDVERWSIKYNNGLVILSCNNQLVGRAYCAAFSSWCQGIAIQQQLGNLEVSRIDIQGQRSGYTADERQAYEETVRLRVNADQLLNEGEIFKAIEVEKSRIPIMEKAFGEDDYSLGLVHQWIGQRLSDAAQSEQALAAFQKAVDIFSKTLGANHPETLLNKTLAAWEMSCLDRNEEAEKDLRLVLQELLLVAGPGSSRTQAAADFLTNVLVVKATDLFEKGNLDGYAMCLQERLELMTLAEPDNAWSKLQAKRDYDNALLLKSYDEPQQQLMAEWMRQVGKSNLDREQGRELIALEELKSLLEKARKLFGEDHLNTIRTKSAVANCAFNCGNPGQAILFAEEAVDYWRRKGEKNDSELVLALIALGSNYSAADRGSEAEILFREAATICYRAKQLESQIYAICLLERGRNQIRLGNNSEAKISLTHALKVFSETSTAVDGNALKTRDNLADLCRVEGDLIGTQAYLDQQRSLVLQKFGKTSSAYIELLIAEAMDQVILSRFDEAVTRYEEALEFAKEGFGKDSRLYEVILEGLVMARARQGNNAQVNREFLQLVDLQRQRRESLFECYPERLQFDRVVLDRPMLSLVLQFAVAKSISTSDAYNRVLGAKGAVTHYQRSLRLAAFNPESKDLIVQIRNASSRIASLIVQRPTEEQQSEIKELLHQKEKLHVRLAQQNRVSENPQRYVTVDQLQESLLEDVALIDYVVYDRLPTFYERVLGKTNVPAMLAFVITKNQLQVVELGDVESIDSAALEWLDAVRQEPYVAAADSLRMAAAVDERGIMLRKLVWDPLEKLVGNSSTVIVSPDAFLVACPFAALPLDNKQGYLIEKKAIVYTGAASTLPELLNRKPDENAEATHLLLVNDVDYGKAVTNDKSESVPFLQLSPDEEGLKTLQKEFLDRHPTGKIKTLSGARADEDEFKQRVEEASFVHLETHGFCLRASDIHMSLDAIDTENESTASDPIVSGIAFAHANESSLNNQSNDGVLWADEISTLNLQKAELVILFACQSALGSYAAGEGMLGCQRALSVAGAQASMGTLWSVEVDASRELMKQFYHNLWNRKLSKAQALQAAMIQLMWSYPESRESTPDSPAVRCPPALWSGFVLSGNWR